MFHQIQQQINSMRQDINSISNLANQLAQSEQSHAQELQRIQARESNASRQLQQIGQLCNSLNNALNQISGVSQQYPGQMMQQAPAFQQAGAQAGYGGMAAQYGVGTMGQAGGAF
ncbi:hypothetical protein ACP3TI_13625, partial [Desulforudis sp. 1190]